MSETVLHIDHFRKVYGDFVAVDDLSLNVQRGEIFGLLGPNGAGKTSTLECLEGIRKPDGGTLEILGVDPARQPHKLRDLIGVQLQLAGLPASMQVREAMRFFCAYHRVAPRDWAYTTSCTLSTMSCRWASSGAWPWPWRWPIAHRWFSWTSRPPGWTWNRVPNCTR
jgi:ABC-type multidrug transport system ATPase subunit